MQGCWAGNCNDSFPCFPYQPALLFASPLASPSASRDAHKGNFVCDCSQSLYSESSAQKTVSALNRSSIAAHKCQPCDFLPLRPSEAGSDCSVAATCPDQAQLCCFAGSVSSDDHTFRPLAASSSLRKCCLTRRLNAQFQSHPSEASCRGKPGN